MTFDAWVPGLIATGSMGVLIALTGIMLRQGDQPVPPVRTLVTALLGALLGFFVGIVVQDTWHFWYACILCAIGAGLALVVDFGRGDNRKDAADVAKRQELERTQG